MEIDGEEERSSWFVEVYKNSNAEAEATLSKTEMRPFDEKSLPVALHFGRLAVV